MVDSTQELIDWYRGFDNREPHHSEKHDYWDDKVVCDDFGLAVSAGLKAIAEQTGTSAGDWNLWTIIDRFDPGYVLAFECPSWAETEPGDPAVALVTITNDGEFVAYPNSVYLAARYVTDWDNGAEIEYA